MTPLDAAFHVVHDYAGGAESLAPRLNKHPTTLCQEVRPPKGGTAKLGLATAVAIQELTGDHRILHAEASQLGYRCVRISELAGVSNRELMASITAFAKETGEALIAAHQAIEDGRITENEIREFEKQVADIVPAAVALAERLRSIATEQARERVGLQVAK